MALKLKREVERERAKGNEERRKCVFFDLLDSFSYTGGSRRRGRGGGGGPCWIPSLSVTPSPLKRPRLSFYFTNTPNKKPRHHLPKDDVAAPPPLKKPKKPRKPHDGDTSSGASAVNVKKVTKSRNLPKAAVDVDVNVNVKTVTVKKKKKKKKKKETTPFTAAEKWSEAYRRVPPDFNFKPPRSCHHLIQEDHTFDHWRILVICMLLNMTTGKQVKKVVEDFFVLCPDAENTTKVDAQQIQNVISTMGLHNKRAHMIKRLSEEYLRPDWTHVTSLHGIGKYAADAYAIFCTGKGADVRPQDHKLVDYWNSIYSNDTSSDAPM